MILDNKTPKLTKDQEFAQLKETLIVKNQEIAQLKESLTKINQQTTSNIQKLLNELFSLISNKIQNSVQCRYFIQLLWQLGKVQSFSSSEYLSNDKIDALELEIKELENLFFIELNANVTPKWQLLLRHVVPFIRFHGV